jgi:NhaP-type Na+/H+ and K+/H+ antiporter
MSVEDTKIALTLASTKIPAVHLLNADADLRECCEASLAALSGSNNPDSVAYLHTLAELGLRIAECVQLSSTAAQHLESYLASV